MEKDTFCHRLNQAMRIRNIKAAELSEKTGISKSSLSEYIKGKYEAKQKGIFKLARVLNVSEAWLMGLDVPMEKDLPDEKKLNTISLKELFKDQVPLLRYSKSRI